jgi:hypothetical protein
MIDTPADRRDAEAVWADAANLPDDTLGALLDAAWSACVEYLPARLAALDPNDVPGPVLRRWQTATVLHARELWNAAQRDGDVIGFDTYGVRARPLTDSVRGLLRPARGVPMVG